MVQPPKIHKRSYEEIVRDTEDLVERLTAAVEGKGWRRSESGVQDAGGALIRIFARMAELAVERINRIPEKNFRAFLDLIGTRRLPPQPARVPLTFQLAAGSPSDARVPGGTAVAAPPGEEETEPVIFETEQALAVTRSQLVAVCTREPSEDRYSDHTPKVLGRDGLPFAAFQGDLPIPHRLYMGQGALFGIQAHKEISLRLHAASAVDEAWWSENVEWAYWDGADWVRVEPKLELDDGAWNITLEGIPALPSHTVDNKKSAWLRGELTIPLLPGKPLLRIDTILTAVAMEDDLLPDRAFANLLAVDVTKDFFPFGEKPRVGDTLYLASDKAFSMPGASIRLDVTLTNLQEGETPPPAQPSATLVLAWEFWNGQDNKWALLGESGPGVRHSENGFSDETRAFTQKGKVTFACPGTMGPVEVNGQFSHWIRVRIKKGDYGREAEYRLKHPGSPEDGYELIPATFRSPSLSSVTLHYDYRSSLSPLDYVLTENDFVLKDQSGAARTESDLFTPFVPAKDTQPALYLGFERPGDDTGFANTSASLYFGIEPPLYGETGGLASSEPPGVIWEFCNGDRWSRLGVQDETQGFTQRGRVTFIGPPNFRQSSEFGLKAFWLRARWERGAYPFWPRLRRILTNTVWASQVQTIQEETLGSSNGEPGQVFRMGKTPVLPGAHIEVREPERPSAEECRMIEAEEGKDAITPVSNGHSAEVWVRWHQSADFYESGPRSRHYVLDWFTGEIRFGNNRRGLVPPPGRGNVRAARYRIGGGSHGNRPAGAIVQLKGAIPLVDSVTNVEPARGGSDAEPLEAVKKRGPRQLRHRDRAVVGVDFEDLALAASADGGRVKAVVAQGSEDAGSVGLIVVPRSMEPKPVPSLELLDRIKDYIEARLTPTVDLWVVGPDWLRVSVTAEIVPLSMQMATTVQTAILERLTAFLHPLTGGLEGEGWPFGRKPHRSDFYALIERTPGIDHIRRLIVTEEGEVRPERFLVHSGEHLVTVTPKASNRS